MWSPPNDDNPEGQWMPIGQGFAGGVLQDIVECMKLVDHGDPEDDCIRILNDLDRVDDEGMPVTESLSNVSARSSTMQELPSQGSLLAEARDNFRCSWSG